MKYVFVCKHGQHRSATCARIAHDIGLEKKFELETDYVGISENESEEDKANRLNEADRVFVMEENMRWHVKKVWHYYKEIICLNIEDREIEDKEIREKLLPYIK